MLLPSKDSLGLEHNYFIYKKCSSLVKFSLKVSLTIRNKISSTVVVLFLYSWPCSMSIQRVFQYFLQNIRQPCNL